MQNPFQNVVNDEVEPVVPTDHKIIDDFRGENDYLSNFYMRPFIAGIDFINDEGETGTVADTFPSVEHAFQASKTLDRDVQKVIRDAGKPSKAKKLGRKVKLRSDWEEVKVDIMERLVLAKFSQNPDFKLRLLSTGDAELIEGNTWQDTFWGVTQQGVGENHLGKILMRVRQSSIDVDGSFEDVFKKFLTEHHLDFLWGNIKFEWE